MIRAVGNKRLDLSSEEYKNYKLLEEIIDKGEFVGLFNTDKNGNITSITIDPERNVSMVTISFINHVMINQRFRIFASSLNKNTENFISNSKKISTIEERVALIEQKLKT